MSKLWAITSYYNPAKYRRRLENYRTFRRCLTVPLVTVELAQDGQMELGRGDADILVQAAGGAILWHKERLLNRAIASLPNDCDAVAWVDCDILFELPDLGERALQALDRSDVVQPFRDRRDLSAVPAGCPRWTKQYRCNLFRVDLNQWPTAGVLTAVASKILAT